jgi:hypothetical protein
MNARERIDMGDAVPARGVVRGNPGDDPQSKKRTVQGQKHDRRSQASRRRVTPALLVRRLASATGC